ncbi:hypothetical protein BD311DRAFT_333539 [Dichomitus squalens]|uniref:HNH nuclease domain-containing protein n=1 Tax=Dichomitus squalens TaxID=114155 RepID=A0A4Q9ML41_9APHY|nr:hypothetical protein BD311DRAFT_333539 [Dichomitus squalens]
MSASQPHHMARSTEIQIPQLALLHRLKPVTILHPGYSPEQQFILLSLPAYPQFTTPTDGARLYGVACCLVIDACRILTNLAANNQGDYLAYDLEGNLRVPAADDTFLESGEYFYHLGPMHPAQYPIVAKFNAFIFPVALPAHWSRHMDNQEDLDLWANVTESVMSDKVKSDDGCCIVTKHYNACDNAHLVPKEQQAWFLANAMGRYNRSRMTGSVDDVANGITLRSDVHRLLDLHAFVFYPIGDRKFVTYIVQRNIHDYAELLHGRTVTVPLRVSYEFLYARFAYNIIKLFPKTLPAYIKRFQSKETLRQEQEALRESKQSKMSSTKTAQSALSSISDDQDTTISEASEPDECDTLLASESQVTEDGDRGIAFGDDRYKTKYALWFPRLAELPEVDNPPESLRTTYHPETPKMLRLRSEYIKKHPQVWQTSTTPAEATRPDVESLVARSLVR